jgi:hypothetical protein
MPFTDSMTSRSRRKLEDERLARLLGRVEGGDYLGNDDSMQDDIKALIDRWKNAEIVGRTSEAEEARTKLLQLLVTAEEISTAPDRELEEQLVWKGIDDHLEGRTPWSAYSGDYTAKQKVDRRGRLIQEVEIPGVGTRTRVFLSAAVTAELMALQKDLQTAELGERTARASGRPAGEATARREEAEAAIDKFCIANRVRLPVSRPLDLGDGEEVETNGA